VVQDGKAETQNIKIDRQIGDLAVVSAGLKGGETIVTRVPRNLRPGLHVTQDPVNDVPAAQITVPGAQQ
jgi:multidrug efflux pump subunit AcrA (membrane-fusion protein)